MQYIRTMTDSEFYDPTGTARASTLLHELGHELHFDLETGHNWNGFCLATALTQTMDLRTRAKYDDKLDEYEWCNELFAEGFAYQMADLLGYTHSLNVNYLPGNVATDFLPLWQQFSVRYPEFSTELGYDNSAVALGITLGGMLVDAPVQQITPGDNWYDGWVHFGTFQPSNGCVNGEWSSLYENVCVHPTNNVTTFHPVHDDTVTQ